MAESNGKDRLFALDVLRGTAACLVLVRHLPTNVDLARGWSEYPIWLLHRLGWCGVDLFFVLSGFLISSLLFKEFTRHGDLHLARFWARRSFKIWPAYFVAYGLMVLSLLFLDRSGASTTLANVWPNLCFIQNFCPDAVRWPHSWSIAVEEHFYLALPLFLSAIIVWRRRRGCATLEATFKGIGVVLLIVCGFVLILRILAASQGADKDELYYQTQFRLDALCFGVLLGYLKASRPEWFARIARAWPMLLILVPIALLIPILAPMGRSTFILTFGFTALYLAFGILVLLAGAYPDCGSHGPRPVVLPARFLAWVGVYSYTIYLSHSVVYKLPGIGSLRELIASQLGRATVAGVWADRLLFWSLSIGFGVLLARVVEQPFLRLRDRWYPSRGRTQNAPRQDNILIRRKQGQETAQHVGAAS